MLRPICFKLSLQSEYFLTHSIFNRIALKRIAICTATPKAYLTLHFAECQSGQPKKNSWPTLSCFRITLFRLSGNGDLSVKWCKGTWLPSETAMTNLSVERNWYIRNWRFCFNVTYIYIKLFLLSFIKLK